MFFVVHLAALRRDQPCHLVAGFLLLVVGVTAIIGCVYVYDEQMAYPGVAAVIPSSGAAFIILAGFLIPENRNPLAKAPLVWMGNRSYSLYLWHWPVRKRSTNPILTA